MTGRHAVVTCAVAAAAGAFPGRVAGFGADWPQWRGPNRDGVSTETGLLQAWKPGGPPLAWRATGLGTGYLERGRRGRPHLHHGRQGRRAAGHRAQRRRRQATVDGAGRRALGTTRYGGPRGTPTVDGDLVYALGTEGDLVCLEAATGKERWRRNLPARLRRPDDVDVEVQRVAARGRRPRRGHARRARARRMVALDKRTGKDIWRASVPDLGPKGKDGAGYSSIVISNGGGVKQYVQLMGRGLVGVRASDGKFLWGYNRVANDVANIPTPIVRGELVFASTGYQTGAALLRLATAGGGVEAREVYFLERAHVPEPPRRHGAGGRPRLRRPRPQQGLPHLPSSSRPARWPGAATSATPAPARPRSPTPTASSTSATRTAR